MISVLEMGEYSFPLSNYCVNESQTIISSISDDPASLFGQITLFCSGPETPT